MEKNIMNYNEINWNEAWKHEMDLWHNSSGKSCKDFWADKKSAAVYSKKHIEHHQERIDKTIKGLPLTPKSRVLDIGSGPGSLALPMAGIVNSVTTIEPSAGMNAVMKNFMEEKGIENIIPIEKTWEDVNPDMELDPPYDLVMASMSLGMNDIKAAIEKMNQVCSGVVVLFWHAGIPGWEDMPKALWPRLFEKQYHGGPKSDILFQVLYQMGIYPEVKVFSNHFHEFFPSMEDAIDFYCKRFDLIRTEHLPLLESYLEEKCFKTEEGFVHGFEHVSMKFSWKIEGISHEKAAYHKKAV